MRAPLLTPRAPGSATRSRLLATASPLEWLFAASLVASCAAGASRDSGVAADAGSNGLGEDGTAADADPGHPDVPRIRFDVGLVVHHDAGAPAPCAATCDCPQGLACLGGACRTAGIGPVWCCMNPGCPAGEPCLDTNDRPSSCRQQPDAGPDAGPKDIGAGAIGAACKLDTECDPSLGATCWEQMAPPYFWDGYCTIEDCLPACPGGTSCITINGNTPLTGCMQSCAMDTDCRSDAYCLPVPNSSVRICLPDCRDDLFDCAPRNGATYCNRATGRCEMTPMQTSGVEVGDPCADNRDCGPGQVCMGELAWNLPNGMCTRVCRGLPEATSCSADETCQTFAGIGLCFKGCAQNACPNRPGAACSRLDPSWASPSCIPQ